MLQVRFHTNLVFISKVDCLLVFLHPHPSVEVLALDIDLPPPRTDLYLHYPDSSEQFTLTDEQLLTPSAAVREFSLCMPLSLTSRLGARFFKWQNTGAALQVITTHRK